ncbi:MAG: TA system VapC family ribonuclease toxin [Terriglobia bacterium]
MKCYFPDINVWLALAYQGHQHHATAAIWFERVEADQAVFCRATQLGFLRLLTHPAVMRDEVKTQQEAWEAYDRLSSDARVAFYPETQPERLEAVLRELTVTSRFAHQQWPDAYLAAFARVADLTLVTLDKALGKLVGKEGLLLQ